MGIAKHTRVRRSTCQVFIYKILHYKWSEFFSYVQNKMWKAMLHCRHPGIIKTIQVATTRFFFTPAAGGIIPCFHSNAYYFISLFMKHQCRNGTINTAAHSYQNFSFFTHAEGKDTNTALAVFIVIVKMWKPITVLLWNFCAVYPEVRRGAPFDSTALFSNLHLSFLMLHRFSCNTVTWYWAINIEASFCLP